MVCDDPAKYRVLVDWDGSGFPDPDDLLTWASAIRRVGFAETNHEMLGLPTVVPSLHLAVWCAADTGDYTLPTGYSAVAGELDGAVSTSASGVETFTTGTTTGDTLAVFTSSEPWSGGTIVVNGFGAVPVIRETFAEVSSGTIEFTTSDDTERGWIVVAVNFWDDDPEDTMNLAPQSTGIDWQQTTFGSAPDGASGWPPVMLAGAVLDRDGPQTVQFPIGNGTTDNHAYMFVIERPMGDFVTADPGEDVTSDVLARTALESGYGRDQNRALSPPGPGTIGFELCNVSRDYSPENPESPFFQELQPGRAVKVEAIYKEELYPLAWGHIDDFDVTVERADRTVQIEAVDLVAALKDVTISTELYRSIRSGDAIRRVLDAVDWPEELRIVDDGVSVFPWWWEDNTDGLEAVERILFSEGPPAVAYIDPDGMFVYRDRHHRMLNDRSLNVQGIFSASKIDCTPESFNSAYEGMTFNEFNTAWAGKTFNDFNQRPLAGGS